MDDDLTTKGSLQTKYPAHWRDPLLRPEIFDLFFRFHASYFHDQALSHRLRQCLSCLVSAASSPGIFANEQEKAIVAQGILSGLDTLLNASPPSIEVLHGMIQLFHRLLNSYRFSLLATVPIFSSVLSKIFDLTIHVLGMLKALTDSLETDDTWTIDAADLLLESWASTIQQVAGTEIEGFMKEKFARIFSYYVDARLELAKNEIDEEDMDDDEEDMEFKDYETYADQLCFVAQIGRSVMGNSASKLLAVLTERVVALKIIINGGDPTFLGILHEQLHWIILISGFLLADDSQSEKCLIPTEVMNHVHIFYF